MKEVKAFAFDLDATLIDSHLDFDLMRKDLDFPKGVPILEHLETIKDPGQVALANKIIQEHEMKGALVSTVIDGVSSFLELLEKKNFPTAILTRNNKEATKVMLKKVNHDFKVVLSREDCLPKPNPEGLIIISKNFKIETSELIFIGDHYFDMKTAHNAKSVGLFYDPNRAHHTSTKDTFSSFNHFEELPTLFKELL